jgi:hypothetical protein
MVGTEKKRRQHPTLFSYTGIMRRTRSPRYVQEKRIERDLQIIYWFLVISDEKYLYVA